MPAIIPTIAPTGASMPSPTRISVKMPAAVAGTSIEALSVSISKRLSPGATRSPTFLNQVVILPELTVSPSCGINTSIRLPLRPHQLCPSLVGGVRQFQARRHGDIVGGELHA